MPSGPSQFVGEFVGADVSPKTGGPEAAGEHGGDVRRYFCLTPSSFCVRSVLSESDSPERVLVPPPAKWRGE